MPPCLRLRNHLKVYANCLKNSKTYQVNEIGILPLLYNLNLALFRVDDPPLRAICHRNRIVTTPSTSSYV